MIAHLTHTKAGDVTLFGLRRGYIQASSKPGVKVILELKGNMILVHGTSGGGTIIGKSFKQITPARAYLKKLL